MGPAVQKISRRSFLKVSLTAGGALAIGLHDSLASASIQSFGPHVLVTIFPDNSVVIRSKNPEIGQGIKIALPLIIAEEMDVAWKDVKVTQADVDKKFGSQFAGGSLGVRLNWQTMREAGASIRAIFRQAAAIRWNTTIDHCLTENGTVINQITGQKISYGALIPEAKDIQPPKELVFKAPGEYNHIGNASIAPNADLTDIVSGRLRYASDHVSDNMLYASIERAPFFEGQVESVDDSDALKIPGVRHVFVLNNKDYGGRLLQPNSPNFVSGVAVLASNTWAAMQSRKALKIKWSEKPKNEDTASLRKTFDQKINESGELVRRDGKDLAAQTFDIESTYLVPFLAHVPMEPMNCVAHFHDNQCEVWIPTQNPEYVMHGLTKVLALPEDRIKINMVRAGGAFGRRYYADFAIDTALLSKKAGVPVKVTWTREDDLRYDYFRPSSLNQLKARIDPVTGKILSWKHKQAGTSRNSYLGREGPAYDTEMDSYNFPAGFVQDLKFEFVHVTSKVPLGQWRGIADSVNLFVILCFMDEIAFKVKRDPIEYFQEFLGDKDEVPVFEDFKLNVLRLRNIINRVRDVSGWRNKREPHIGYGFAAGYTQSAFVAVVAAVRVQENRLQIMKVTVVVDCGLVINPSGARAQVEGSVIEGLSSALFNKIYIEDSSVATVNFHQYKWIRMKDVPEIDVHFVPGAATPRGLGEPVLPLVAPALCNAIFNASGKRIYSLPTLDNGFEVE
jgi:isoquinoline 1-oxidoreductase beta subunit